MIQPVSLIIYDYDFVITLCMVSFVALHLLFATGIEYVIREKRLDQKEKQITTKKNKSSKPHKQETQAMGLQKRSRSSTYNCCKTGREGDTYIYGTCKSVGVSCVDFTQVWIEKYEAS